MARIKKSSTKRTVGRNRNYLTKRRLASAARMGIRIAAANTMTVMGYTVVAHEGWVVKKHADGTIEKITPLATQEENANISLD
jgi:ribosomal protein S12